MNIASGKKLVRVGTRGSPLALAQAEQIAAALRHITGGMVETRIVAFTTTGDRIQDRPLQDAGGKGLFTRELDRAQEDGELDIAVHSLKDVPGVLPDLLELAAHPRREDARDCLLGHGLPRHARLADLPPNAVVGTSSLRRRAQVLAARPDLSVVQFRGNVQTRLQKLADGVADATLLAAAGLKRLGLFDRAAGVLEFEEMLPAPCQGVIGVTIRKDAPDWLVTACAAIDDRPARLAAAAERAFLRALDGSCRTAIAAHFRLTETGAWMAGEKLSDDGDQRWRAEAEIEGAPSETDAAELGLALAEDVLAQQG